MAAVTEHMESLERQLERIASFFGDPRVKYAAEIYLIAESIVC